MYEDNDNLKLKQEIKEKNIVNNLIKIKKELESDNDLNLIYVTLRPINGKGAWIGELIRDTTYFYESTATVLFDKDTIISKCAINLLGFKHDDIHTFKRVDYSSLTEEQKRSIIYSYSLLLNNDNEKDTKPKPKVQLPGQNNAISSFANDISIHFNKQEDVFYSDRKQSFAEIIKFYDKFLKKDIYVMTEIKPTRMLNIIEKKIVTYYYDHEGRVIYKSASEQNIKLVMSNDKFINTMPKIDRLITYPMPFIINDELILPKHGYDSRFNSFMTFDSPIVADIGIDKAKEILLEPLKEFCFKEDIDKVMALAELITPACRGLYKRITCRTPMFMHLANRERAGKDYLAGITGIIYEGQAVDDPPISDDGGNSNTGELRKKLTGAIMQGRRRLHFANNRGHLANAVLEQFITSENWRDRLLGMNKEVMLNNEMDVSLSANIGITYSPDVWNRCRPINLFLEQENANDRIFIKPDLHGWVLDNRDILLSAIYTLIKSWVENGMPSNNKPFASFPEWARVVGGIMTFHDLGDPCIAIEDTTQVGGDMIYRSMKQLWENMYSLIKDSHTKNYTVSQIRELVMRFQENDDDMFHDYDLGDRSGQTKFANEFIKYVGRELSGIKCIVAENSTRKCRIKYTFIDKENDAKISSISTAESIIKSI